MKIKKILPLLAMLAAGSMLCLSGCNVDATNINEEEVTIEEEIEEEDLAEGMVLFHSVWYDADGDKLPDADVAFYDGETLAFSGTTDENGEMESFSLPCNTTLSCSVTDEAGNPIAESDVVIKLSDNYETIAVYPTRDVESEEETPTLKVEIPTDETNLRAGFYVTQSGTVSLANLTPYVKEETDEAAGEESEEQTDEEQTEEEQTEEEQPAEKQAAEKQSTEKQAAEKQSTEKQAAEKQSTEKQSTEKQAAEKQSTETQPDEQEQQPAEQQAAAE